MNHGPKSWWNNLQIAWNVERSLMFLHAKSRVQKYEVMPSVGCINILFIDVGVITECTWSACSEFRCRPSEEYIYFRIFLDAKINHPSIWRYYVVAKNAVNVNRWYEDKNFTIVVFQKLPCLDWVILLMITFWILISIMYLM